MADRILTWFAVLFVLVVLDHGRRLQNERVLADGQARAADIQHLALRLWAEEDLRRELRRFALWCWCWATVFLVVVGALLIVDLVTGGVGHAR